MSYLDVFLIGLSFLLAGLALRSYAWAKSMWQFAKVQQQNTTIDPNNPPRIVWQKSPAGGTIFSNEGGPAKHTPTKDFTSYEDVMDQIDHSLRWFKRVGYAGMVLGPLLMIGSAAGYFLI